MHRRRADGRRRFLPGLLLLAAGVVIAVAVPSIYAATHRDPGLQQVGQGIAVQLAQQSAPGSAATSVSRPAAVAPSPTPAPRGTRTATGADSAPTPPPVSTAGRPNTGRTSTGRTTAVAPKAGRTGVGAAPNQAAPKSTAPKSTAPNQAAPKPTAPNPTTASTAAAPVVISQPARLQIPAIGIDAPIEAVGVDDQGEMAIPEQVQQIGWYRYGAAPGDTVGSVVMSGHVDSAAQGLGAFADLSHLSAGDLVTVSDRSGRRLSYRVVGKEAFDKKTVPLADLFSRKGAARLTLITCGGDFDAQARSYLDNIVVTAVPIGAAP